MNTTQGPWYADGVSICARDGNNVGIVNLYRCNEADARLIAAAPELLKSLQWAIASLKSCGVDGYRVPEVLEAEAAIAKATGAK